MQVDSVSNGYSEWSVFVTCSCSSFDVLLDSTNAPTHSVTLQVLFSEVHDIRESVDSLCRDGADAQYMQYLSKSRITSPQIR